MPRTEPSAKLEPTRLCLVTPASLDPVSFAMTLDAALAAGDVACLFLAGPGADAAASLAPVAQRRGVAAIVVGDAACGRASGADGVHVESGPAAVKAAVAACRPGRMVGAGGATDRDAAMLLGEIDPDYVFFGRLDGDTDAMIHGRAFALAEWWSSLFQIPAVVMGGNAIDSVAAAAGAGIEFVCLGRAVWDHEDGPDAAVALANRHLAAALAAPAP